MGSPRSSRVWLQMVKAATKSGLEGLKLFLAFVRVGSWCTVDSEAFHWLGRMWMTLHVLGLKICQVFSHVSSESRSSWRRTWSGWFFVLLWREAVISKEAGFGVFNCIREICIKVRKSRGPRTVPCGTHFLLLFSSKYIFVVKASDGRLRIWRWPGKRVVDGCIV